jgi:histidinol-phosphate aminotransferase
MLVYTLSKIYGLAGLRVGYGVMNSEVCTQLEKVRLPFNLGNLQQKGSEAALGDIEFYNRTVKAVDEGKIYLTRELQRLGFEFLKPYGNFIFCDFGPKSMQIIRHLADNCITIRPLVSFGFSENFVRISVGDSEANRFLIEKIEEISA